MTCDHLRKLFQLCDENELRFSSSDLVHIVCKQCEREEVCPSMLVDEYDAQQASKDKRSPTESNTAEQ